MSARFQIHPDCAEIVVDTQTGLLWQRGFSTTLLTHANAIQYATNLRLGGFADWRLPTREELMGLLTKKDNSYGYFQDPVFGDRGGEWLWCWSATIHKNTAAWVVVFSDGYEDHYALSSYLYARAVRIDQVQTKINFIPQQQKSHMQTRFQIHPDCSDIIVDTQTGLLWQRSISDEYMNYADANIYTSLLCLGGYENWRLPTREELASLLTDDENMRGYYQDDVFDDAYGCWSITLQHDTSAWIVNFRGGYQDSQPLSHSNAVRAVREG